MGLININGFSITGDCTNEGLGEIIFSVTGFLLLQRYATTRAQTWPLLIAGLVLPLFFMLFLIH